MAADADADVDANANAVTDGGDGPSAAAAAAENNNNTNDTLPSTTHEQCNLSVASTPTHSSSKSSRGGVRRSTFPASPALSTLSKNTSSSGNSSSFASAVKMSVDDILSSSKLSLGARQKAMRIIVQKKSPATLAEHAKQTPTSGLSSGGTRPQDTISSSTSSGNIYKLQQPQHTPGQEERKKRLERLQQDVLHRQLSGKAKMKQQNPELNSMYADMGTKSEDGSSKQSSVSSKKRKASFIDEVTSKIDSSNSSPPSLVRPSISVPTSNTTNDGHDQNRSAQSTTSLQTPLDTEIANEPDETDEPESAQSALTALLAKYDSCISSYTANTMEGGEGGNSAVGASPWTIAQSLVTVLSHINLFDPSALDSEECRQVVNGLAQVFMSSDRVKWEVMNRTRQGSGAEEILATTKEYHLLLLIQIQVWMRMMVWSLERDAGWDFLMRVISLADATWGQARKNGKSRRGKKKKARKDERGSASESLVHDLRQLMELAPYVLPASLNFSQWLKDILTFGFRQPVPEYGAQLFDHFEIEVTEPIALKRSGTDNSGQSERSEVSNSPIKKQNDGGSTKAVNGESPTKQLMKKRQQSQQAYFASLAEEEKSTINGADDESATATGSFSTVTSVSRSSSTMRERVDPLLLKTSISLTAAAPTQTSNPFLKGSARGVYVGSHLGSKLSNITSLFREVKAPAKPVVENKVKNVAPKQRDNAITSATSDRVSASTDQNKRKSLVGNIKSRMPSIPPEETPFKRPRQVNNTFRDARAPMFAIEETPMRSSIDETPAKKPIPTARTRLRLRDELPCVGDSIVAETPQQYPMRRGGPTGLSWPSQGSMRQPPPSPYVGNSIIAETPQQPTTRRGCAAPPSVLPTNLWHRQDVQRPLLPPPTRQPFHQSNNPSLASRRQQMQSDKGNNGRRQQQQHHLSPINHPGSSLSTPMNFGLSPIPNQEDMAQVMAKVAKSAARKEKG